MILTLEQAKEARTYLAGDPEALKLFNIIQWYYYDGPGERPKVTDIRIFSNLLIRLMYKAKAERNLAHATYVTRLQRKIENEKNAKKRKRLEINLAFAKKHKPPPMPAWLPSHEEMVER